MPNSRFNGYGNFNICFDRGLTNKELQTLEVNRTIENEDGATVERGGLCGAVPNVAIGLSANVRWDGKVFIPSAPDDDFAYERYLVQRSFEVQKQD